MEKASTTGQRARFTVENIGGIDETTVELRSGVTVLTGRNATNRTSFLQAIMAALGSDDVSLKGDAESGSVELALDGETYTRELARANGSVTSRGDPYLDDPAIADLFAFLLESNEARRAVARGTDLRELIMRPVDTDAIRAEIRRLEDEKSRVEDELEEVTSLKSELPKLEGRRNELEAEIDEKRAALEAKEADIEERNVDVDETREDKETLESRLDDLREKRAALERVRSDIDLQEDSIESLTRERRELEAEREKLSEAPTGEPRELDDEIARLRDRKERLERDVSHLQDVVQFNEDRLEGEEGPVVDALRGDDAPEAVTDRLVGDESVTCWTCGSEVDRERIADTLEELREVRRERLEATRDVEDELEALKAERREREERQRRRETVELKIAELGDELDRRERTLEGKREKRERLGDDIGELEAEIETLESAEFSDVLDLHKEANRLEFEMSELESDRDELSERIEAMENRLAEESQLRNQREEIRDELRDLRTRIDRIEAEAIEEFNTHMEAVLETLDYENLERIWIERVERRVREGRRKVEKTAFELHVVRSTASGATYEDTVDHLSESEREVTGLVFALAGYLVHELHETVPFMLLDSLEAIDADRLAELVDYIAEYPAFLVVALLPEDAQALDEAYARVTDI